MDWRRRRHSRRKKRSRSRTPWNRVGANSRSDAGARGEPSPNSACHRGPRWPQGIVGSITHCKGFVGAVVAPAHALHAIGFDAERADPLALDLIPSVCTAREIAWVESQQIAPSIDWPKVIFSAKEALHKCVSPSTGRMLDFRDVTLLIDPDRLTFEATAAAPGSADGVDLARVRGRIAPGERFVFTYAVFNDAP
jgi:4'-phosphopantetheinyl transferase EntD